MDRENKDNAEDYLLKSLNYYENKSGHNKRWYIYLVVADTIISAFIPFATLFIDVYLPAKYIVAFMGCIITVVSAFLSIFGFHKNWVEFRTTAEILKYHKYLYKTCSTPYNKINKDELLILNVNTIVEKENRNWRTIELNIKKVPRNP